MACCWPTMSARLWGRYFSTHGINSFNLLTGKITNYLLFPLLMINKARNIKNGSSSGDNSGTVKVPWNCALFTKQVLLVGDAARKDYPHTLIRCSKDREAILTALYLARYLGLDPQTRVDVQGGVPNVQVIIGRDWDHMKARNGSDEVLG